MAKMDNRCCDEPLRNSYLRAAEELVADYTERAGLPRYFFRACGQSPHSLPDREKSLFYVYYHSERGGCEIALPVAVLNKDGILRFLIPDDKGALKVFDLNLNGGQTFV